MKLNVLLAKVEHGASPFREMIKEYIHFFKNSQKAFQGNRKTYAPKEGMADDPSKQGVTKVATTVYEKLEWFERTSLDYLTQLFAVEATNASGNARAELVVDGISFGLLSSLELLRLISLLEKENLEEMYKNIPVRSDGERWSKSSDEMYIGREVYEGVLTEGTSHTDAKEEYVLVDPNIQFLKDTSGYKPSVGVKTTRIPVGDYTVQFFSGESTHRERAEILRRRTRLLQSAVEALKKANEVDVLSSNLDVTQLYQYLHFGPQAATDKNLTQALA